MLALVFAPEEFLVSEKLIMIALALFGKSESEYSLNLPVGSIRLSLPHLQHGGTP